MTWRRQAIELTLAGVLLTAGAMAYITLRSRGLLGFGLLDAAGLGPLADSWRQWCHGRVELHAFAVYCLPGGLWAAAYVLVTDAVFAALAPAPRLALAAVIPVLGIASEALQALRWLPGTPDPLDALCYAAPLAAYALTLHLSLRANHSSPAHITPPLS